MSAITARTASLWHAYRALEEHGKGGKSGVAKSQLKVLTHNLATCIGFTDVDSRLQERFSTEGSIEFSDYLAFLGESLFARITSDAAAADDLLGKVDEVCWMLCSHVYGATGKQRTLRDGDIFKLWRIFNCLAETTAAGDDVSDIHPSEVRLPVVIHTDEVQLLVNRLSAVLRSPIISRSISISSSTPCRSPTVVSDGNVQLASVAADEVFASAAAASTSQTMDFAQFLYVVEVECLAGRDQDVASATVAQLYDDIVANVLKQGYLQRRVAHGMTTTNEQGWYVLTPSCLRHYSRRDETEQRTAFTISNTCRVENLVDKQGIAIGGIGLSFGVKANRFVLHPTDVGTSSKPIEFTAVDAQTKSEWIQALRSAIESDGTLPSPYIVELRKRQIERAKREAQQRLEEERMRAELQRMEQTRDELERERKAREEAEQRCIEEAELRKMEQQRNAELEELQRQLEALLEQERKAKREEEIVRSLQAKVLQEEFDKREQLEEMKNSLEQLLAQEHDRTVDLEERRRLQEEMLREEQERLLKLQQERQQRDHEYKMALAKLQEAERAKQEMQDELMRKETDLQRHLAAHAAKYNRFGGSNSNSGVSGVTSPSPIVSHRGLGAFVEADFALRRQQQKHLDDIDGDDASLHSSPPLPPHLPSASRSSPPSHAAEPSNQSVPPIKPRRLAASPSTDRHDVGRATPDVTPQPLPRTSVVNKNWFVGGQAADTDEAKMAGEGYAAAVDDTGTSCQQQPAEDGDYSVMKCTLPGVVMATETGREGSDDDADVGVDMEAQYVPYVQFSDGGRRQEVEQVSQQDETEADEEEEEEEAKEEFVRRT